jgi:hypothetical protein
MCSSSLKDVSQEALQRHCSDQVRTDAPDPPGDMRQQAPTLAAGAQDALDEDAAFEAFTRKTLQQRAGQAAASPVWHSAAGAQQLTPRALPSEPAAQQPLRAHATAQDVAAPSAGTSRSLPASVRDVLIAHQAPASRHSWGARPTAGSGEHGCDAQPMSDGDCWLARALKPAQEPSSKALRRADGDAQRSTAPVVSGMDSMWVLPCRKADDAMHDAASSLERRRNDAARELQRCKQRAADALVSEPDEGAGSAHTPDLPEQKTETDRARGLARWRGVQPANVDHSAHDGLPSSAAPAAARADASAGAAAPGIEAGEFDVGGVAAAEQRHIMHLIKMQRRGRAAGREHCNPTQPSAKRSGSSRSSGSSKRQKSIAALFK